MFVGGRKEERMVVNISAATAKKLMRLLVWWPILEAVVSFVIGIVTPRLAKILKKYDKRTGGLLRLPFIQKVLEQPFFITDLVSKLVKQCEYMIDTVFPVEEEERVKEGREAITVAGEGIFRDTIAALMTMQEIRRGSSTYSHFSLPPLNLLDSDLIQSL